MAVVRLRRISLIFGIFILSLVLLYMAGPKPDPDLNPSLPPVPASPDSLDRWIHERERKILDLKENANARIVWHTKDKSKTEFALVYLHGFTASPEEGAPVHRNIAEQYGMNLYLARLAGHGRKHSDAMAGLKSEQLVSSAAEALAIGRQLGKKVILMGTSTGATLSLYLAAHHPEIHGLILYSPLIDFFDSRSWVLTQPWGRNITEWVMGGKYVTKQDIKNPREHIIWNQTYRVEGTIALGALVKETMTPETFQKITQPLFMGYYYKNDTLQDSTVSVEAMQEMFEQLSTPQSRKWSVAFPHAGSHVICSSVTSDAWREVQEETAGFLEEILNLTPIEESK